ncbi:MAG TPA: glycosyltransferase [Stellaceae bacterium]|jgi:glycosyltransferase involved in cell wall biosynthesis|nr:glycosyltransferase [Stellaceae bacterium]
MNRDAAVRAPRPTRPIAAWHDMRPVLAIVIPVYKHSVLLGEAVISALNQQTDFEFVIVIVNDGCPMAETHQACLDFVAGAPERVHYIRRCNGGLSAARNTGIEHVLAAWESVQAIYFLDADNRLLPGALQRGFDGLLATPEAGWLYPDIDMFGQEWNSDYSGEYSVLRHLEENICEAGSLVRRAVFERGVRFDESMRLGFEDWDFWLAAIGLGFRGRHIDHFGFRYRKRPESMLSDSERDRPEITAYLSRKHRQLYRYDGLMTLEHREAPRYAVCHAGAAAVYLTSDPALDGERLSPVEFFERYYRARRAPTRYARPPFVLVIDPAFKEVLARYGLLRWAFWLLESAIDTCSFAYLIGAQHSENDRVEIVELADTEEGDAFHAAGLVMVAAELLDDCLDDLADSWIASLATSLPQPKIAAFRLLLPGLGDASPGRANFALLQSFKEMRDFQSTLCRGQAWHWRPSPLSPKHELFKVSRKILNASPVYPRVCPDRRRHIGFIVPLAEFGGVEKTAYNLARVMRANGWSTHLFVFCKQAAQPASLICDVFDSLNFLCDPQVGHWDPEIRYMGSHYPSWVAVGRHSRAMGLLCGLDVVANFHCAEAHALMAPLRRCGAKTIASLHVTDLTQLDRPNGHPYLTLGYEHAYDLFACCSRQLLDWCHAMGVPEAKLSLLWNAPSYDLAAAAVDKALAARRRRRPTRLRVLFLGRLDRQKGLDRLTAIARLSRKNELPLEWRLIGASVIGDAGRRQQLEDLSIDIEPPKLTAADLTECYGWADVVLLVSRWEGLPLTILEAMRLGLVVCTTAVGAVAEAVVHNETGFLLAPSGTGVIVRQAVEILRGLCHDRGLLLRVSSAAAAAAKSWSWENSAKDLLQQLDRLTTA